MLGGRVKTLHPRIHAGILARRNLDEDVRTLAAHEIEPFDLVCVNLYPFAAVAARRSATEAEVVEMIDVGGPSMLRAAAKNFAHVAAVSNEAQYAGVLAALREHGEVPLDARRELARDAFAATAAYESAIATWFAETESFPDQLTLTFRKATDLSYGENPHQAAAFYREAGTRRHLLSHVDQLGGKELSYNNLVDLEAGRRLLREFAAAGGGDREAREPVRRRGRRHDRGRLGARARRRPRVGVRVRRAAQPAGVRRARRADRRALRRGADGSRLRRRRDRRAPREAGAAAALEPRPARRDARRARLQARPRRPAGAGPGHRDGGPRRRWRSSAAS